MSDKPRVGTYLHGEAFPNKLSIYNGDYYNGKRSVRAMYPWFVDRGNEAVDAFLTYEEALDFVRDELAKQYPMEVS